VNDRARAEPAAARTSTLLAGRLSDGTLIGGAHAGIVGRLDALEATLEHAAEAEAR
jgi:hypothetical protein